MFLFFSYFHFIYFIISYLSIQTIGKNLFITASVHQTIHYITNLYQTR